MATPLYKKMRNKGTSFYAFPSSIRDFSLYNFQDNIKISPSKFILLNIPTSVTGTTSIPGVLDFVKSTNPSTYGTELYSWDPDGPRSNYNYSETLIEGLRNYVANADTVYRESRITLKKDFYNLSENKTPTEMIFWKWCRKMNIIDFEPGVHAVDWDKNLPDFDNENASAYTNRDHFRKYLWKEREVIYYDCSISSSTITISGTTAKFKIDDFIKLSGYTGAGLSDGVEYKLTNVQFSGDDTILTIGSSGSGSCKVYLSYQKLVQYIGEVQAVSKVQTSQNNFTEFTAMIPPHAGKTPTILWEINANSNYYPSLELPILADEIQSEIKGAEYLSSPIRTNPGDYPGSYFGYFDTTDKTYMNSTGDRIRYNGEYYGILRTYNDGLFNDTYKERLTEFNSNNIDGLNVDFNRKHYLKMNLPNSTVKNFDEFNAMVINSEPPEDFEFNAILWYYELDDGSGNIVTNLYGIEFLNNPDDDFGTSGDKTITTTRKLVTNDSQDGLSYIYNLNLDFKMDNNMVPMTYDPTSVYNLFGFDLYTNVMENYGKLNQSFMTIIDNFITLNKKMLDLESIMYSQTDLDQIKDRLETQEELLKMYQTNQFVESDTIGIEIDYTKNYPALKFNSKTVDYDEIYNYYTSDIVTYNVQNSNTGLTSIAFDTAYPTVEPYVGDVRRGSSWVINVPSKGKTLVNVFSDIVTYYSGRTLSVVLDKDLYFKQSMDFIIRPDIALYTNKFQINVMFDDGTGTGKKEKELVADIHLPIDVTTYDSDNPTGSTFSSAYYYDLETYVDSSITGSTTLIDINESIFDTGDWVYIDSFYFDDGTNMIDYSGLYNVLSGGTIQLTLDFDSTGIGELQGRPRIFYYKGVKISILRINEFLTSDIDHRYLITRTFIDNTFIQKLNL